MTATTYYSIAILLAAIPAWALISGKALGVWWWRAMVKRQHEPMTYWLIVSAQFSILVLFLFTGSSWHLR